MESDVISILDWKYSRDTFIQNADSVTILKLNDEEYYNSFIHDSVEIKEMGLPMRAGINYQFGNNAPQNQEIVFNAINGRFQK